MRKTKYLSIEDKRDWLAGIFRDSSGEFSQADKFKAMVEDTRLAELQDARKNRKNAPVPVFSLLEQLPPPRDGQEA